MIRVVLPYHLRNLARVDGEVTLEVSNPVTLRSVLDALESPAILWEKRCYFLNTNRLNLRPIKGHWMISRRPPRVYDRYVHYFALTAKAALTTGKRNAHAVLSVA